MRISTDKKICAALRIISNCNHALVSAFYSLINQEIPCQLERIALQEGLTDVFFKIYERATGNAIAEKNKLFEHCLLLFDYLEALRLKITDE